MPRSRCCSSGGSWRNCWSARESAGAVPAEAVATAGNYVSLGAERLVVAVAARRRSATQAPASLVVDHRSSVGSTAVSGICASASDSSVLARANQARTRSFPSCPRITIMLLFLTTHRAGRGCPADRDRPALNMASRHRPIRNDGRSHAPPYRGFRSSRPPRSGTALGSAADRSRSWPAIVPPH